MVEPRLLLLRLWAGESPFRAVVREFDPERSRHFDDPQALIDFVLAPRSMSQGPTAEDADTEGRTRT
ncbi:MAG TPA: hypothetical protein PKJ32_06805 [Piscinibacter sp.]|nr:hypothetical protein [Piscinibacter sp.]HPG77501.1 hypothetical protein [Piscinibacter sp.]